MKVAQRFLDVDFNNLGGGGVEIIDNLTAGGTDKALSAEQGKVLAQHDIEIDNAIAELNRRITAQTTPIPNPELTELNKEGEVQVNFFVPWKYALVESSDVVSDIAHLSWRFPYAEGRIKKVSIMAVTPGDTKVSVRVDGRGVIDTPQTVTSSWVDYNVDVAITYNQKIYIASTYSLTAEDLHVSLVIEVGNKDIVFVGEPDLEANVYKISNNRTMTSLYMPSVDSIDKVGGGSGWFAKNSLTGKMYIFGDDTNYFSIMASEFPNRATNYSSPIEYPVDGVQWIDKYCRINADGTTTACNRDNIQAYISSNESHEDFIYMRNGIGILSDGTTLFFCSGLITHGISGFPYSLENGEKFKDGYAYYSNYTLRSFILTESGKIFKVDKESSTSITCEEIDTTMCGPIKAIWCAPSISNVSSLFALNANNDLYAKGWSNRGQLGLSSTGGSNGSYGYLNLTWVGNFGDIKKMYAYSESSYLLTPNGEIYFAGRDLYNTFLPDSSGSSSSNHEAFTRAFENYYFYDIVAYSQGAYAICKKLGDMPS